jgi:hypothetical protein
MLRTQVFAFAMLAAAPAIAAETNDLLGAWRVTHGRVAPWTDAAPIDAGWIGARAVFAAAQVRARAPLGCARARYAPTSTPPEGLFMGGLAEAGGGAAAAAALGFTPGEVAGVSLACSSGLWEFHRADGDTMLFALDNVVWTMTRAYGARARKTSPEGVVEAFLEGHFNSEMAFKPEALAPRRKWLSRKLAGAISAYFERQLPGDEPPPINGDPYTDSQDYPLRFAVRKGAVIGRRADVPVDFSDAFASKRVIFRLARGTNDWRIDDLAYGDGATLKASLRAAN